MKQCGKCGRENWDHARFCTGCGSPLPDGPKKKKPRWLIVLAAAAAGVSALAIASGVLVFLSGDKQLGNAAARGDTDFYQPVTEEDVREENGVWYADSRLLLTTDGTVDYGEVEDLVSEKGGEIIGYLSVTDDYQIFFPEGKTYRELQGLESELLREPFVEEASVNLVGQIESEAIDYRGDPWIDADDPLDASGADWDEENPGGKNWWAEAIHMPTVWEMDLDAETVKVGIYDSMFDTENEDLDEGLFRQVWFNPENEDGSCRVTELYEEAEADYQAAVDSGDSDAASEAADRMSNAAHGSHVAGIIGGQGGNGFGIAGINQDAELYGFSVKSEEASNSTVFSWGDIFAYKYALSQMLNRDVRVINISMGFSSFLKGAQEGDSFSRQFLEVSSRSLENFLLKYIRQGKEFLICKAAGNESTPSHRYDAAYDLFGMISNTEAAERIVIVGAAACHEDGYYYAADFTNTGDRVDVYAPGVDILSDYPTNVTALMSGTSMSTPIVTGLASLIWGINPDLSAEQVRNILEASTYASLFNLDGKSTLGREWAEVWHDVVAIVDANICVQLAEGSHGMAEQDGQTAEFGAVQGVIYYLDEDDSPEYLTVTDISVLNQKGQVVQKTEPHDIALPVQDPQTGALTMLELSSYDLILEPGTYTIRVTAEDQEPMEQEVTVTGNETGILNFEFQEDQNSIEAYAEIVRQYEDRYGELQFYELSYSTNYTGVFLLQLVDFDQNGTEELVIGYSVPYPEGIEYCAWPSMDVWTIENGTPVRVYEDAYVQHGDIGRHCQYINWNGTNYLVTGWSGSDVDLELLKFENGEFVTGYTLKSIESMSGAYVTDVEYYLNNEQIDIDTFNLYFNQINAGDLYNGGVYESDTITTQDMQEQLETAKEQLGIHG